MDLTHDPDVAYDMVTQRLCRLRRDAAVEHATSSGARQRPRLDVGRSRRRIAGALRHLAELVEAPGPLRQLEAGRQGVAVGRGEH